MVAETKYFGTIDVEDDKIIHFPMGIIGFENLKNFALIYDIDNEQKSKISWFTNNLFALGNVRNCTLFPRRAASRAVCLIRLARHAFSPKIANFTPARPSENGCLFQTACYPF